MFSYLRGGIGKWQNMGEGKQKFAVITLDVNMSWQ